jgi:hypothetical protein
MCALARDFLQEQDSGEHVFHKFSGAPAVITVL